MPRTVTVDGITYIEQNTGVLQDWLAGIGLKMQSILLSGLRATDSRAPATKKCVRWLRGASLRNGDPEKQDYMQKIDMTEDLIWEAMEELQYQPAHFVHHFADAFAVMAYHHPNREIREFAGTIHGLVAVELFHFKPETEQEFKERHKDRKGPKQTRQSIVEETKRLFFGLRKTEIEPSRRSY